MQFSEKLEQAVYYTASESLEGISGMGIIAASRTDVASLRSMNDAFRPVLFLPYETAYSFLYHADFGFCVAATTARKPSGSNREAPYVHIIFSGAHPNDPASTYGFQAHYQTGETALPQVLPPLERTAIPQKDILSLSGADTAQLAGLIRRLWRLHPLFRKSDLLLSTDILAEDVPVHFQTIICALMDLLPGSMREWLWATTASTDALSGNAQFPIRFSPSGTALDRLPRRSPRQGDYFGALCVRMAESYRDDRMTFYRLTERMDKVLRSKIQFTRERLAIAICCAFLEEPDCPWAPGKAEIAVLLENLETMLPNLNRDLDFWREQVDLLREASQERTARSLLKQFQRQKLPMERQCVEFADYYRDASEKAREEFAHACRRALTSETESPDSLRYAVWLCHEADLRDLMERLYPAESRQDFYPWLKEQLDFWRPLLSQNAFVDLKKAEDYYTEQLRNAPIPAFRDIGILIELLREKEKPLLFDKDVAESKIQEGLRELTRLPPVGMWTGAVAAYLQHDSRFSSLLRQRWEAMGGSIRSGRELKEWTDLGPLLGIPDYQKSADDFLSAQLQELESAEDVKDFLEKYGDFLNRTCEQGLRERIRELFQEADSSQTRTLETLRSVWEFLDGKGYYERLPSSFQDKLTVSQMEQRFQNEPFRELLQEQRKFGKLSFEYREWANTLWADSIDKAMAEGQTLQKEDFTEIQSASAALDEFNSDCAEKLCEYFYRRCYEHLSDFWDSPTPLEPLFQEAGKKRLLELARCSGLSEIVFHNQKMRKDSRHSGGAWSFDCPPEPWETADDREKRNLLSRFAQAPNKWRFAYKKSLCKEVPLSRLFERICSEISWKKEPVDDELFEELLEYVALLTPVLPDEKKALEILLKVWAADADLENSLYKRKRELYVRLGELNPKPNGAQKDAIDKTWRIVFKEPLNLEENMRIISESAPENPPSDALPFHPAPEDSSIEPSEVTVIWLNGDGTQLDSKSYYANYPNEPNTDKTPTKKSDARNDYAFSRWTLCKNEDAFKTYQPEFVAVKKPLICAKRWLTPSFMAYALLLLVAVPLFSVFLIRWYFRLGASALLRKFSVAIVLFTIIWHILMGPAVDFLCDLLKRIGTADKEEGE